MSMIDFLISILRGGYVIINLIISVKYENIKMLYIVKLMFLELFSEG